MYLAGSIAQEYLAQVSKDWATNGWQSMNGHDPKSTHIRTLDIKFYRITKSLTIDVGPNAHANRSHCTGYIKHNMMYNYKQLQQPNPIHYSMYRRPQYCEVLETIYACLMTLWLKRVHVKT